MCIPSPDVHDGEGERSLSGVVKPGLSFYFFLLRARARTCHVCKQHLSNRKTKTVQ